MNFFKELIRANSGISSKRFISMWGMLILTATVIVSFCGVAVSDTIYYVLSGVILSESALTLGQKSKRQNEL